MDTVRYRAFLTAADKGTIKEAADKLGYTSSAVSQLISSLESDLGIRMMDRGKKGVTLTENGKKLLPIMQNILNQEDYLYQMAANITGLITGTVTIGTFSSIATLWLPQVIQSFQKLFPGIKINIQEGPWEEIRNWLNCKEIDLGFCSLFKEKTYDWIPLAEDRMVVVISNDHPLANETSFPIKQLSHEPLILPQQGQYSNAVLMLNEKNIPFKVRFTTKEVYASMAMAKRGLGVSVLNELVTNVLGDDATIIPVDPPYNITLGIAIPNYNDASPAVKCFIQHATKLLKQIDQKDIIKDK